MCMCGYKPENWHYSPLVTSVWVLRMSPCRSRANAIYVLPTCVSLSRSDITCPDAVWCSSRHACVIPVELFALILTAFSSSAGVLKRTSCSWICKSTGMDVRTRLPVTLSCLHAPLESPQLPPQHLTPCLARPPCWKSTAPSRVSRGCIFLFCWFSKYECHTTCKTVCCSIWSVEIWISGLTQQVVCGKLVFISYVFMFKACVFVFCARTVTVTSPQSFHCKGITSQMWFHRVLVTTSKLLNPQFFMWLTT